MAKINYFSQLLLLSVIGIHSYTGGDIVVSSSEYQVSRLGDEPALAMREAKLKNKVKQIYDSQIGIREHGNNSGPAVEKYLAYTGLTKSNPWCAAFVCWVYGQAGVTNPRTGWSPSLFPSKNVIWDKKMANAKRAISKEKHPTQADIFAIYFADKGRIAHTGFIDSWDGTWLITVEGNTNTQGSREGDGVYRKRRMVKSIYQVARYVN